VRAPAIEGDVQVILFRHGPAADREGWSGTDASRPLTAPGRKRTRSAAKGLRALGSAPELVLCSPLIRAKQTASLAARVLELGKGQLHVSRALAPNRSPKALLEELAHLRVQQVLCVGHAPHLDRFVELVLGASPGSLRLKKAGAACVELDLPTGHGHLNWVLEGRALRALGRTSR
jgi:phosphohistidine phosphatase